MSQNFLCRLEAVAGNHLTGALYTLCPHSEEMVCGWRKFPYIYKHDEMVNNQSPLKSPC